MTKANNVKMNACCYVMMTNHYTFSTCLIPLN